jgi:hypothetical protein
MGIQFIFPGGERQWFSERPWKLLWIDHTKEQPGRHDAG